MKLKVEKTIEFFAKMHKNDKPLIKQKNKTKQKQKV